MLVWLINATWGSSSGCVHTVPQSLPGHDKKFLQLLPLRTRSSKEDISTLTCSRSGLAPRTKTSPLSCHKPTDRHNRYHNICQIYIQTPARQRGLYLFLKLSFDTSKLQKRKGRIADKPSKSHYSLVNLQLTPLDPTALSHPKCRKLFSDTVDKWLKWLVFHIPNCVLICFISTMMSAPWRQGPIFCLVKRFPHIYKSRIPCTPYHMKKHTN